MNRDELRWALVQEFQQARGGFAQTKADVAHADALLDGPVGDLLAEVERLRAAAMEAADAQSRLRKQLMAERDALRAQVAAVAEYAEGRAAHRRGVLDSVRVASDLRQILNAADGGDRGE